MSTMPLASLEDRLADLAAVEPGLVPVVSVYLDTRWRDEHQRDRARVLVKTHERAARERGARPEDLAWLDAQVARLVDGSLAPGAPGVALFAGGDGGLREVVPSAVPFEDAWFVDGVPVLGPLAAAAGRLPEAVVVFVDAQRARLIPLSPGAGAPPSDEDEVVLASDVPGHHRRGGWLLLAQSRYQRHIAAHRDRHYDAVAGALGEAVGGDAEVRIVLAGEPRRATELRQHLPAPLDARVAGVVPASRHESAAVIAGRAAALLAARRAAETAAEVEAVITEAAKGGRAVTGAEATFAAAARGAVRRLYLLRGFRSDARACRACGYLVTGPAPACPVCRAGVDEGEASATLVDLVLGKGGAVDVVDEHRGLAEAGGVAARLRYPI
jgi:rubrerythrin